MHGQQSIFLPSKTHRAECVEFPPRILFSSSTMSDYNCLRRPALIQLTAAAPCAPPCRAGAAGAAARRPRRGARRRAPRRAARTRAAPRSPRPRRAPLRSNFRSLPVCVSASGLCSGELCIRSPQSRFFHSCAVRPSKPDLLRSLAEEEPLAPKRPKTDILAAVRPCELWSSDPSKFKKINAFLRNLLMFKTMRKKKKNTRELFENP